MVHLWQGLSILVPQLQCHLETVNTSQCSPDKPAPLRCGTHATQNQLPWRYHNFALLADASPPSNLHAWVGLCICLHLMSCLYTIFVGAQCKHFSCTISFLPGTTHFSIEGDSVNVVSMVDFWMGRVDKRLFGLSRAAPPEEKNQESNPHRLWGCVAVPPWE